MVADQGLLATPVIARSDPYADIESFSQRLIAEDSHKWCAIMPWDFPIAGTKEAEDEFLLQFFKDHELHVHNARFLAQVWKCIALYNAQFRIPAMVEKWIEESTEIWKDPNMAKFIFSEDAQPSSVFSEPELKTYPEAFLKVAVKGVQTRLENMELSTKIVEPQSSTPAVSTAKGESADPKAIPPAEAESSTAIKIAASPQIAVRTFLETHESLGNVTMQHPVPATAAHPNAFLPPSNGASNGAYAQPDHRPLNYKKPRGGHNTKRSSFSARNGPRTLPPPGFEDTRQPSNSFSPAYGPPPTLNAANGLPYMPPGRVSSGGQQFGGNEQVPPPHLQFQPPPGPPSTAYMPSMALAHPPRYPIEQGVPGPRLYHPGSHGPHMQYYSPYSGQPQETPPMFDRTNLQANAPAFNYEPPTNVRDDRGQKRRDSVASRGSKRGYGGSMRGRSNRGGRESFSYPGNVSDESNAVPDTKPRWIMQRDKNPVDGPWRSGQDENSSLPSQDVRNSISDMQKPAEHTTSSDIQGSFGVHRQAHDKATFSQPPCKTTCTKDDIAHDCTTATKLIIFDTPSNMPETELKTYFSQFGKVKSIGGLRPVSSITTHCNIWITFTTVDEARKCLAARGHLWPFGQRDRLQVENAKQHWDGLHRFNQPQQPTYASSAPSFIPHHGTQATADIPSLHASQQLISDAPPMRSVAGDGTVSTLSQDTTPTASGTTTPKKKAKSNKKKKPKKTDLLAADSTKAPAEAEPCSEHKSPEGDQTPSMVVDNKVLDLKEAHESPVDEILEVHAGAVEHGGTGTSKLGDCLADDSFHPADLTPKHVKSAMLPSDETPSSGTPTATSVTEPSDYTLVVVDKGKTQPDEGELVVGSLETMDLVAEGVSSLPVKSDSPAVQQQDQNAGVEENVEAPKAVVQYPCNLKDSRKAPIPKVPGSRTVSNAAPDLTVKASPPAGKEPVNKSEREVNDTKGNEADGHTRSASGGSERTTGFSTGQDTAAIGIAPKLSTEQVAPQLHSVAEEPKSIRSSKPKGPEQTESLSVFSSKGKKPNRKVSKPTKARGSIKGKPATADIFASPSQDASGTTSGRATPAPQQQPLQGVEAVQADLVWEPIDAPHPEHRIHEPGAVKMAVPASEVRSPPPTTTASPPRTTRRGTFGTIFSYIRGGSQGSQSTVNGSQADSKVEDKAEQDEHSVDDNTTLPSAAQVVGEGTQAQADISDAAGLGISNDATNESSKSKKKKTKPKGKKEAHADVTACDSMRTEITRTIPLYEYAGNDAAPEISTADSSALSESPSGRKTRAYLQQKEKNHIIEPKPLRKTHRRAASSKLSSDDGTDKSSAVAKSNRLSSEEMSAAQAAQRARSPPFAILLVSPRTDSKQVIDHLFQQDRFEDVTDMDETEMSDSKVFDSKCHKADANDRVSPEVEEMRARLHELHEKEKKVKESKGKERAEAQ